MARSAALRPNGLSLPDHGAILAPLSTSSMADITAWHLCLDTSISFLWFFANGPGIMSGKDHR